MGFILSDNCHATSITISLDSIHPPLDWNGFSFFAIATRVVLMCKFQSVHSATILSVRPKERTITGTKKCPLVSSTATLPSEGALIVSQRGTAGRFEAPGPLPRFESRLIWLTEIAAQADDQR
jgi:hypothetical protein